jgi:ribosomal protein S18 acetylase RimI-like enzyme
MMHTIQLASAADCLAVIACVHDAYVGYVERIGRPPAPMGANYADLIARGDVYVVPGQVGEGLHGVIVMRVEEGALFIENVAVHPRHQKQGLGSQLMAFAEAHAVRLGVPEIRLYTHARMTENIAFYTRRGYVEVDRRLDEGFARVFMRKRLG